MSSTRGGSSESGDTGSATGASTAAPAAGTEAKTPVDESTSGTGAGAGTGEGAPGLKEGVDTAKASREVKALDAPVLLGGEVVHGFGRGSKVLGIPTANLSSEALGSKVDDVPAGVYFGWANVADGPVYKAVLSVGWNPYFKNTHKTVEPHLLHEFSKDFYGSNLQLLICGVLRPEFDFKSLEDLIAAIKADISVASEALDSEAFVGFKTHEHFGGAGSA